MSNSNPFEFSTTIDVMEKYVSDLQKQTYNIQRKAMATGGRYIASQVRSSYSSFFHNPPKHHDKSGMPGLQKGEPENLKKSVKNKAFRKPKLGQTIYSAVHAYNPFNPKAKKVLYGAALQKGFSITAKNDKYLTFQVDGKWKKKHEITVPKRPWITDPAERAANSYVCENRMSQTIQKEVDKLEKKYENMRSTLH